MTYVAIMAGLFQSIRSIYLARASVTSIRSEYCYKALLSPSMGELSTLVRSILVVVIILCSLATVIFAPSIRVSVVNYWYRCTVQYLTGTNTVVTGCVTQCRAYIPTSRRPVGGGGHRVIFYSYFDRYILTAHRSASYPGRFLRLLSYDKDDISGSLTSDNDNIIKAKLPFVRLFEFISVAHAVELASLHSIKLHKKMSRAAIESILTDHDCSSSCSGSSYIASIEIVEDVKLKKKAKNRKQYKARKEKMTVDQNPFNIVDDNSNTVFPPDPLSSHESEYIIRQACKKMDPIYFEEAGCAVCGLLKPSRELSPLSSVHDHLHVINIPGVSRKERRNACNPITSLDGPVLDHSCNRVCKSCRVSLKNDRMPRFALAKGLWIGPVPPELADLRYVERILVSRVRHSVCWAKVACGMRKMKANVVCFEVPIPKVYTKLPPPREDVEEVLAILFTGPSPPSGDMFKRTPFLVRRNHVYRALQWLLLNHCDYFDIEISHENLAQYPEDVPPVTVDYMCKPGNKEMENISLFDNEDEEGSSEGDCPITVHGITGHELQNMSTNMLKAKALKHLNGWKDILVIGHEPEPVSIWKNPQLYPQMFPWLFPYGTGGMGTVEGMSITMQKRHYLMYHDKRFQLDINFPFVAFSHEQMSVSSTYGHLLAEKDHFADIANRLLSVHQPTMQDMINRMSNGEIVKPDNEREKQCFKVFYDLDHILGHMDGSITNKKYMRNEIWSLIALKGSPSWYVTLSPADVQHPICMYMADTQECFRPDLKDYNDRIRALCRNPVASARFFHFLVEIFVTDVLGVESKSKGVFGDTSAYYGTVEQQGRLALHLHMLIWVRGNISPQEIRNRILIDSDWQRKLILWLEGSHVGEYLTGTADEVRNRVEANKKSAGYRDPTTTLPLSPPVSGNKSNILLDTVQTVPSCDAINNWWQQFEHEVDDILYRSNLHDCNRNLNADGSTSKKQLYVSCRDNKWKKCKARFPRQLHESTEVDPDTGAIQMKKLEAWLNTMNPIITYLLRCNTDVTSLLSGTAVKAVVMYVTDYITKQGLKTHVVFDAIRSIISKDTTVLCGDEKAKERARKLMTKIVNMVTAKMEMGAPMISMYLLGNPDHYTSHKFVPFYWINFVNEVSRQSGNTAVAPVMDKVRIGRKGTEYVPLNPVDDYMYRPDIIENMAVYDFVRCCSRVKKVLNAKGGLSKNTFLFKDEHPLSSTHALKCSLKCLESNVPNFIGGTLPRPDSGSGENYNITLLALFVPWRTVFDIKQQDESWDNAVLRAQVPQRLQKIIRNLNLKYECLDARDDFRAQLRASGGEVEANLSAWLVDRDNDSVPTLIDDVQWQMVDPDIDPNDIVIRNVSKYEENRIKSVVEINQLMTSTGWAFNRPFAGHKLNNCSTPHVSLTNTQWRAEINKKRQGVLESRLKEIPPTVQDTLGGRHRTDTSKVFITNKSYLTRHEPFDEERQNHIDTCVVDYKLNYEQEKAFRIVANHASDNYSERLNMYIGGMGGTGKSQVLKALIKFFQLRNESYRLIVVAPTGSAAALLGGMTYHSAFGINDKVGCVNMSAVKSRLLGVDYVFFDEVSMLSAYEMYRISARLCRALNTPDISFGGLSMIFAGDFAQLPPPLGGESVSLYGHSIGISGNTVRKQKAAIGKSLWHEVTTVVILRKNMRQTTQSEADIKFRRALENMRYKACTTDDIIFLKSRISSNSGYGPSITDDCFRNVSIITTLNVLKDAINDIGARRFADETGQQLSFFYSEDEPTALPSATVKRVQGRKGITEIIPGEQKELWFRHCSTTDKLIPGRIGICVGLPVMIRSNSATELCMTKGQEGFVHSWESSIGSKGQPVLVTLFVLLHNPPTNVQFDGLPLNVVPIMPTKIHQLLCRRKDGTSITISRTQVEIHVNFSMTDFASQGKTRQFNAVDLQPCRSHQSMYTALSRGTSADGTIILRDFSPAVITGGISGALRQEFRSLEMLDEITDMIYNQQLPNSVEGTHRRPLISSFRAWKGAHHVPKYTHNAIKWNKTHPWKDDEHVQKDWTIVDIEEIDTNTSKTEVLDSTSSEGNLLESKTAANIGVPTTKRKTLHDYMSSDSDIILPAKKARYNSTFITHGTSPSGIIWNNNSCAYDAVLVILLNIHRLDPVRFIAYCRSRTDNTVLQILSDKLQQMTSSSASLEHVRDAVRAGLNQLNPHDFSIGMYTSTASVINALFKSSIIPAGMVSYRCAMCSPHNVVPVHTIVCPTTTVTSVTTSVSEWIDSTHSSHRERVCHTCRIPVLLMRTYSLPGCSLLAVHLPHEYSMVINREIMLKLEDGRNTRLKLYGIIYFEHDHFTSRLIGLDDTVWFHDGIASGRSVVQEGTWNDMREEMGKRNGAVAVDALYWQV